MVIIGLYLLGFGPVSGTDIYNTGQPPTYLHICYGPLTTSPTKPVFVIN